jgi:hypothetical protein
VLTQKSFSYMNSFMLLHEHVHAIVWKVRRCTVSCYCMNIPIPKCASFVNRSFVVSKIFCLHEQFYIIAYRYLCNNLKGEKVNSFTLLHEHVHAISWKEKGEHCHCNLTLFTVLWKDWIFIGIFCEFTLFFFLLGSVVKSLPDCHMEVLTAVWGSFSYLTKMWNVSCYTMEINMWTFSPYGWRSLLHFTLSCEIVYTFWDSVSKIIFCRQKVSART